MRAAVRGLGCLLLCLGFCLSLSAQKSQPGLMNAEDLKRAVPSGYFFGGQAAPVELRNSAGFRSASGKVVVAGLVDTSGYAADVQEKYQGFLITEVKINVAGSDLGPGAYGFGFTKDGKFILMDVGGNELFHGASASDDKLAHPVPLKMMEDGGAYRLYHGRSYVTLKTQ